MRYEIIVMGTSFGGLRAVTTILSGLPEDFPLAIALVQHRSRDSDDTLVGLLSEYSRMRVSEADDKEEIRPGRVYIAPPDYHLLVQPGELALSTEAPVFFSRPSIDVLFQSASDAYGDRVIGVVLTGANSDGTAGLRRIGERGGFCIVQDPSTSEGRAMPQSAILGARVDRVLPVEEIAGLLMQLAHLP